MRDPLRQVQRLALNRDQYRDVAAARTAHHGVVDSGAMEARFSCECARRSCREIVTMTLAEYEAVRANPKRFLIAPSPDHVSSDVERIIEAHDRYLVVERRVPADDAPDARRVRRHTLSL